MVSRKILWMLLTLGALWLLFRKPLEQWYAARQTGLQAVADANTLNRYTTYNTQLYTAPLWQPVVNFFKAGAYVPTSKTAGGQTLDYSVQG